MTPLSVGENALLKSKNIDIMVRLKSRPDVQARLLTDHVGFIWIGFNAQNQAVTSPVYLHTPTDWCQIDGNASEAQWQLRLEKLQQQVPSVHHMQLIAYGYIQSNAVHAHLSTLQLQLDFTLTNAEQNLELMYQPPIGLQSTFLICLEIYRRHEQWKVRALALDSTGNLIKWGQRLGLTLDDRSPFMQSEQTSSSPLLSQSEQSQQWTGTGFAVAPQYLLTCAHVVADAQLIIIQSVQGQFGARVVSVDADCDLALLKIDQSNFNHYLSIHHAPPLMLGDTLTAIGFPLASLMGEQLQVTQGCIAALRGVNSDLRFLQFTAPIQPGSSGSPLLSDAGHVIGMVTGSLTQTQNMNFAVRYQLMQALLESADIVTAPRPVRAADVAAGQRSSLRLAQQAIFLLKCQR